MQAALMTWVVDHVLTTPVMTVLWGAVVIVSMLVSVRLRRAPIALLAAGSLPWFVFYLWTWIGAWPSMTFAVAFSRMAGAALAINLIAGAYFMCKLAGPR